MSKLIDLTGQTFGRITVEYRIQQNSVKNRNTYWLCRCLCGNKTVVYGQSLRIGHTQSCGCLRKERVRRGVPFGEAAFNQRINNGKFHATKRGYEWALSNEQVRVLDRMDCFYCGAKPAQTAKSNGLNGNYTYGGIDRLDNSRGYSPGNVVPCCGQCNTAKNSLSTEDFKVWITRVYERCFLFVDQK